MQKELKSVEESSKVRTQSLLKATKCSSRSSAAEILQLKNSLSEAQVNIESVKRDTKKDLNQVIADKAQTINWMKHSTTIQTDGLKASEKRLKTSVRNASTQ